MRNRGEKSRIIGGGESGRACVLARLGHKEKSSAFRGVMIVRGRKIPLPFCGKRRPQAREKDVPSVERRKKTRTEDERRYR